MTSKVFPAILFCLFLLLVGCTTGVSPISDLSQAKPVELTGVYGRVVDQAGVPAVGAWVYAYRSARSGLRGPADFAAIVDSDGGYVLDLVDGEYWLVARYRQGRADSGPPRAGDSWAPYRRNPVRVSEGQGLRADFRLQTVVSPQVMHLGTQADGQTGFSGRLVDSAGEPLSGGFAFVHRLAEQNGMPAFTSQPVGTDGRFQLFVDAGGNFCLAGRLRTRGQPVAGEPFGRLENGNKGCLMLEQGEIREVGDLVLRPFRP
ncbi:MAG: hypothetical protein C0616_05910 [Desulfuromonas sp.]|nr:MAG: hypothetical protein C0616_05910 [Desulfuromonas sp.]